MLGPETKSTSQSGMSSLGLVMNPPLTWAIMRGSAGVTVTVADPSLTFEVTVASSEPSVSSPVSKAGAGSWLALVGNWPGWEVCARCWPVV